MVVRLFGESSVDLQLRVWITDARKRMDTISEVTDKVKEAFDKHDIEIPYPKRDITPSPIGKLTRVRKKQINVEHRTPNIEF